MRKRNESEVLLPGQRDTNVGTWNLSGHDPMLMSLVRHTHACPSKYCIVLGARLAQSDP